MGFMQAQMTEQQYWYAVDGPCGIDYIPADCVGPVWPFPYLDDAELSLSHVHGECNIPAALRNYTQNQWADSIRYVQGYGVRFSAPGYLDCTEWEVFEDVDEAQARYEELCAEDSDEDC